jgi:hypothetical protein
MIDDTDELPLHVRLERMKSGATDKSSSFLKRKPIARDVDARKSGSTKRKLGTAKHNDDDNDNDDDDDDDDDDDNDEAFDVVDDNNDNDDNNHQAPAKKRTKQDKSK